ncbi:MAG: PilZ domain-containing protein, partial [Myxococcota bacterium]|nr:PilZ domain-containing protein [Myxococcota bacterium]
FVRTSKPLDVGTELVFVLYIPGHNDPLELQGEVMWTVAEERATEEQPAGMGLRFRFASDGERARLDAFVETLMAEKLGGHVAARLLGKR